MQPIVIGAGLAGLTAALSLAPMPVMVLSSRKLGENCASAWAQGGIAAALGHDDTPNLHARDTMAAGAGLCDPEIVRQVTNDGADVIARLIAKAVPFDRDIIKELQLGLEAAHSRRRIVHAKGDGTGAAIMKAMLEAILAAPSVKILEGNVADEILVGDDGVRGVAITGVDKTTRIVETNCVILATGGAGALWRHTTNPLYSTGRGLVLAARAGAALADLEFMQFHPTALDVGRDPMPLASEALRGEGCTLIDENGERFTDELWPRDVVARAIWIHMGRGHQVFLDARKALGPKFAKRFPGIYAQCIAANIDPAQQPIPVRLAAHYHMGGVMADAQGRTSIKGLWACGEVASTGLHGANRLASNSLLEAASFGHRVAEDIAGQMVPAPPSGAVPDIRKKLNAIGSKPAPVIPVSRVSAEDESIRDIMTKDVGVLRDRLGLENAVRQLTPLAESSDKALTALMIAVFALQREESRGAHTRKDHPETSPLWAHRQSMTLEEIMRVADPEREDQPALTAAGA